MSRITPCLWFEKEAEQAARFYTAILPDSRIDHIQYSPADTPGPREGAVLIVAFTLAGQAFQALNGGVKMEHTHAIFMSVDCADQEEVDRLWDALSAEGGTPGECGWVQDRYGMHWQIIPTILPKLLADPDPAKAKRAMEAMLRMTKIDIAALEQAAADR